MKKLSVVVVLLAAIMVLSTVTAFAQASSPTPAPAPLTLPGVVATALMAVVAFFVTQGLKSLSQILSKYPWLSWIDMTGWGSWITAFIVNGLLFYINYLLGLVPAPYVSAVAFLLTFLAQVFAANGLHYVFTGPAAIPGAPGKTLKK